MAISGLPTAATASAEQLLDRARGGQIGLQRDALRTGGLNGGDDFLRFGFGGGAVVVDHHRWGALLSQIARDQPAEVLAPPAMRTVFSLIE